MEPVDGGRQKRITEITEGKRGHGEVWGTGRWAVAGGGMLGAGVGVGKTAGLRWPAGSTERTAKITLSLETGSVMEVAALGTVWTVVQVGASVSRETIS